jgi:hypothetical protein
MKQTITLKDNKHRKESNGNFNNSGSAGENE